MAISHLLEALVDDLDTVVTTLNLPEGSNFSDIAQMAEDGEITSSSGVYKVASIVERDALNPNEGDMCVVTGSSIDNWEESTSSATITFPETVILPSTYSNYYSARLKGNIFNGYIDLYKQSFSIDGWSKIRMRVQYSSNDGIQYTRQHLECQDTNTGQSLVDGDTVTLPEEVSIQSMGDPFDENIGYFMQVGVKTFDGIFTYDGSNWNYSYVDVNLSTDDVFMEQQAYTNNGFIVGILGNTISSDFTDRCALLYRNNQLFYNSLIPRVLTDNDKTIDKTIYVVPEKTDGTPLFDTSNLTNAESLFYNCKNLGLLAKIDTSNVTNMGNMLRGCSSLTFIPALDTSTAVNMSGTFMECSNLTTIPLLDTSNVTDMSHLFNKCTNLTSIPLLNTSNVTNMQAMFYSCSSLTTIPLLDTSNVTNMLVMFDGCRSLTTIPLLDTSNVTNMGSLFNNCSSLETVPLLNTSKVSTGSSMFAGCSKLTTIPLIDTSKITSFSNFFEGCTSLTSVPLLDTKSATSLFSMFRNCSSITTIPQFDTRYVTSIEWTFMNCPSLTTMPQLNTSSVTNMGSTWNGCTSLTDFPLLNTSRVTNMNYAFNGCPNLTDVSLNNILQMCIGATSYTGTKTLAQLGFNSTNYPASRIQALSNYQAFINAGWIIGY